MWLNSHILVCRCRRSSVTEIGEGREQAKMGGPTSLSCWHIQIPAGPCPSPPPALPQDTRILLLMLSPPFSPPSLLPSTSTTPGGGGVCVVCSSASPLRDPLQRRCLPSWHYWPKAATVLAMCSPELGAAAASPFIPCLSLFQGGRKEPPMSPGGLGGQCAHHWVS